MDGFCAKGSRCKFAHGKQDLRPGSTKSRAQKDKTKFAEPENYFIPYGSSGYEQAALKLIFQSALGWKGDCDGNSSFSRQTTCEGVETSFAHFSRCSSDASDISQAHFQTSYAPVTLPHCGWEVRIRNTFIEVEDDKEEGILRKCQSLPNFEALGQAA